MEVLAQSLPLAQAEAQCLVLGLFENETLNPALQALDDAMDNALSATLKLGNFRAESGQSTQIQPVFAIAAKSLLLFGLGKAKEFKRATRNKAITSLVKTLREQGVSDAVVWLPASAQTPDSYLDARDLALIAQRENYSFTQCKSKPNGGNKLQSLGLWVDEANLEATEMAIKHAKAINTGMDLTRDLGNLPGNICTPSYLAEQAINLADNLNQLSVEVLEESDMEKLGMGALLSVSRGSREAAKLIIFHYHGGKSDEKPVVLVGKGLTFDAGGISIKPAAAMDEMKYDMCGGGTVFGVIHAIAELELPINVIGVVPTSENLPDGQANKPGDIVTSMSGQTIEILNTDAEGRLILCDALTYVERYQPEAVIDIATLTGACIVALGHHATGLLTEDEALAQALYQAGQKANDKAWRLPIWDEYQAQLDSNFADMANIGGKPAGTITAAAFLSRYTKAYPWAHLDIAGTAWKSGKEKGATGRPVPMLVEFLLDRTQQA